MIKADIVQDGPETPDYPCIKRHNELGGLVLFTAPLTGVALTAVGGNGQGTYSQVWSERMFSTFHGTVTLSNQ